MSNGRHERMDVMRRREENNGRAEQSLNRSVTVWVSKHHLLLNGEVGLIGPVSYVTASWYNSYTDWHPSCPKNSKHRTSTHHTTIVLLPLSIRLDYSFLFIQFVCTSFQLSVSLSQSVPECPQLSHEYALGEARPDV